MDFPNFFEFSRRIFPILTRFFLRDVSNERFLIFARQCTRYLRSDVHRTRLPVSLHATSEPLLFLKNDFSSTFPGFSQTFFLFFPILISAKLVTYSFYNSSTFFKVKFPILSRYMTRTLGCNAFQNRLRAYHETPRNNRKI